VIVVNLRYHVRVSEDVRYTVDPAKVVGEIIDGEAILINLVNGYYYNLDKAAAEIWTHLEAGRTTLEIVDVLKRRYDCSQTDPETAVRELIATLEADRLIAPGFRPPNRPPCPPSVPRKPAANPFVSPRSSASRTCRDFFWWTRSTRSTTRAGPMSSQEASAPVPERRAVASTAP
jgi:hypothetical protein